MEKPILVERAGLEPAGRLTARPIYALPPFQAEHPTGWGELLLMGRSL